MDPTVRAILRLNLDLSVFHAGLEDDERRRLERELEAAMRARR